jgi:hypothetical protein
VALSLSTFRTAYPEFAGVPDATVEGKLADAARSCNEAIFGPRFDEAVGLLAAHKVALAPGGQHARLESDKADTTYRQEWLRLARMCGGGAWAIGQQP